MHMQASGKEIFILQTRTTTREPSWPILLFIYNARVFKKKEIKENKNEFRGK